MLPLLSDCGGSKKGDGGGGGYVPPKTYTVQGTISGLESNGRMVLYNNGENPIAMFANGRFTFTAALADGRAYNVTVSLKPLRQICTVSNGSGTINSANVTNVQVVCTTKPGGVTLSGRIDIPPGVVIDGSVNDWNEEYIPNESFESAQPLPNPISVGGYVNLPYQQPNCPSWPICLAGRSYTIGNPDDYYQVQLKTGDVVTLAIGEPDTRNNRLDLYLYYSNRQPASSSVGTGVYRMLTAPSEGIFYVKVNARSGASNYILTIGADTVVAAMAAADPGILSTEYEIVPDQVIVRFKDTVKTASTFNNTVAQYAEDMGLTTIAGSPEREMLLAFNDLKLQTYALSNNGAIPNLYEQNADNPEEARKLNTLLAIMELRNHPDILSAEPNYIVRTSVIPNDEHYELQWHYPMIQLPEAWDVTTGSDNVIVAVVDSGVLMQHPDLRNRLTSTGYSLVKGEVGPNPNDPGNGIYGVASSFHGTHVAGTIAAETNNNSGVAGVTWKTKIMPVRVMNGSGSGTSYDVMQGISYAAGLDNDSKTVPGKTADIINLSLGSYGTCVYQDLLDRVRAKGIIVIAAAGNDNRPTPSYPAACRGVISVSAVNINGLKASYSNYGAGNITVAAPGGDSYPDMILSIGGDDSTGSVVYAYSFKSGTSMAAPHVAGVTALMKGVYSGLSPKILDDLLAAGEITDITGGGEPEKYGYGLINAFKAVAAARERAGGGEIAGLNVSPRTVNFGIINSDATASVTVSKIGTGAFSVAGFNTNANWLTVTLNSSVNSNGFGDYILHVDRSKMLHEGDYTASVTFTASSGTSVSVRVTAQIRGASEVSYNAGYHYVLLISDNDDDDIEQLEASAYNGHYYYSFTNVPPGNYIIIAGSNRNNSGYLGDGGEALGAYPSLEQMEKIEATANKNDLNFQTNLILSIPNASLAVDDAVVVYKPFAAMPMPELKRLK